MKIHHVHFSFNIARNTLLVATAFVCAVLSLPSNADVNQKTIINNAPITSFATGSSTASIEINKVKARATDRKSQTIVVNSPITSIATPLWNSKIVIGNP